MFVDEVRIEVQGGRGGDGCISFHHQKFRPRGGPAGGDGGRGGNVVAKADPSLTTLLGLKDRGLFKAGRGGDGGGSLCHGKDGEDLIIRLPLGTEVIDLDGERKIVELLMEGEERVVVQGGEGGKGNARFATSRQRAPRRRSLGREGERRRLLLRLKLMSDAGIVGYPNTGKSTLLSRLSSARPKIAPYPFTTTSPNLGVLWADEFTSFTIIDLPAIVEGAHKGAGLGNHFLRHILRTRLLIHILDLSVDEPIAQFNNLNNELGLYDEGLLGFPQIVVLNKCDLVDNREKVFKIEASLATYGYEALSVSAIRGDGISHLKERIRSRLEEDCGKHQEGL
jgi:GTP-binding protein